MLRLGSASIPVIVSKWSEPGHFYLVPNLGGLPPVMLTKRGRRWVEAETEAEYYERVFRESPGRVAMIVTDEAGFNELRRRYEDGK